MRYIKSSSSFLLEGKSSTLKDIINSDYDTFVQKLGDNIKDPKFQAILNAGNKDGHSLDELIKVQMDVVYKAKDLIPTQNQIGLKESFQGVLKDNNKAKDIISNDLSDFNNNRLLIGNGKYILDGHHRWSQIYFLNPEAMIPCVNIDIPEIDKEEMLLKVIQLCVAATYNTVLRKKVELSMNILSVDVVYSDIRKQVPKIMGDSLTDVCADAYADDESFLRKLLKLGVGIASMSISNQNESVEGDDLLVDVADVTADIAGIFDPTGAIDVAHGLTYLKRGEYLMAVCSFISAVPYIGDAIGKPVMLIAKASKKLMQALKVAVELKDTVSIAKIVQKLGKPFMNLVEKVSEWGPKLIEALEKLKGKYPIIGKFINRIKDLIEVLKKSWKWVKRILGYFDPLEPDEVWDIITSNIMMMKKNKPKFGVSIEYSPHPLQTAKFVGQDPEGKDGYVGVPKNLIKKMKSGDVNFLEPMRENFKWIKTFETFEESELEEETEQLSIEDYPQSVKMIYKRFNPVARRSIKDNIESFAKIAKKVFYNEKKPWKDFFTKDVKRINTLSEVNIALQKWLEE